MRSPRLAVVAWALAVLGLVVRPVSAQPELDTLVGRPVVSVAIVADGAPLQDRSLAPLLDTKIGRPLDVADVRRTLRSLAAMDRFDDITVRATEQRGGVALVYDVRLVRRVEGLAFSGELGLSSRQLRRALNERFAGPVSSARRAPEMAALLADTLKQHGFLDARTTWRLEPRAGSGATLVFDVEAGPRFTVGHVSVTGDPPGGVAQLEQRLRIGAGRPWMETQARERAEKEVRRLRSKGHYQAHVDIVPTRRPGEALVDLAVDARPGPIVSLVFQGDPLPRSKQAELVPVAREGAVDEDLLEDSKRRVEQFLRSEGYWRAVADYRRSEANGTLTITFDVKRGRLYEVGEVDIGGVSAADREQLDTLLSLRPGRPFVEDLLERDIAIVLGYFRERGYAQARVTQQVEETASATGSSGLVRVALAVQEGARTLVGSITLDGDAAVEEATLRQAMQLRPGGPFFAPRLAADRAAVESVYRDRGFVDAKVAVSAEPSPTPAPTGPLADLAYRIREGEQAVVQHVIVTGNERTSVDTILREARIVPGQALGAQELIDAQRRLSALGLFRRVRIDGVQEPGERYRNVVIAVEENAATSIGYGAGVEGGRRLRRDDVEGNAVERFEFAPRGFFEVGRRNLWGKNRSVSLFSRASLRQDPGSVEDPDPSGYGIYEYRVLGTYREPRAFGWNADASVTALFEQAIRSSFSYRRRALNGDLTRRFGPHVTIGGRYSYGYTNVYEDRSDPADQPLIDRLFPQVHLSILAGIAAWDTRDDPIEPTRGHLLGVESDLAARSLGSEVGYTKTFLQGFLYRQLPSSRIVFAAGARLGLATGFPRQVPVVDENGDPVLDENGNQEVETVKDLPASERFYAGGDTTVRGYTLDRLGDTGTIDQDGFPLGGDAVVIFNGELRFPVTRTLGGVVFVDAGNVFLRVTDLDLSRIKATTGFGIRYKSPIGPLRVDLGFKLDPSVLPDGTREKGYAVHISVGQAF